MEINELSRRTSDALRALSHEHRLLILCHLSQSERSVGELEKLLKLAQPAVSQQLGRLRLDRLVSARRDGRTIYYTADLDRIRGILVDVCHLLGYDVAPSATRIVLPELPIEAPPEPAAAEELPEVPADPDSTAQEGAPA